MRVDLPLVRSRPRRAAPALAGIAATAVALAVTGCGDGSSSGDEPRLRTDDSPVESRDGLHVDGANYPLIAAIGEIWGRTGDWPTHFNVDFTLTDGRFAVTPILADGESASVREPVRASAVLRAELYAPGATAFRFADYGFVAGTDASDAELADRHFFVGGRVGVDSDGSGEVEPAEMRDVIGGSIDFEGPLPDIALSFELVLDDGTRASGGYGGFFEFIPLTPSP